MNPLAAAMARHPAGSRLPRSQPFTMGIAMAGQPVEPDPTDPAPHVTVPDVAPSEVYGWLTAAWRDAGRPIVVVPSGRPGVDFAAHVWVAEHRHTGCRADFTTSTDPDQQEAAAP